LFPPLALIAVLPASAGLYAWYGAIVYTDALGEEARYLAANVIAALLGPLLLAGALVFQR
jgi:hypothetical protein